jgi:peptide/nickel transport system permease protein
MGAYVLRRLVQGLFTIFGVMLLTFVLFRLITGDVTAEFVSPKLGKEARVAWLRKSHLDLPLVVNLQRRLLFGDRTSGGGRFRVRDAEGSRAAAAMVLEPAVDDARAAGAPPTRATIASLPVQRLSFQTPLIELTEGEAWFAAPKKPPPRTQPGSRPQAPPASQPASQPAGPVLIFSLRDGTELKVDLSSLSGPVKDRKACPAAGATCGDLARLIHDHPDNAGKLTVGISEESLANLFNSQFLWHLRESLTFSNRSYKTNELLLDIIARRAKYSLAITVPAMALGWLAALVIASIVAYYRGSWIDRLGVLLSVLGMCVPYLVYMIVGQALIFLVAPTAAWGLHNPANVYVPIGIALIAGLGGGVRFYRTVILDQVKQDYVRTARAKGVPLYGVLFRHVLKNCMLPILTAVVLSIPFLVMGSLLLERFFGVHGLGSLMVTSVSDRDVPIISGLTFLTALVYTVGLLVTDVLYAVFDPRIRLR